MLSQCLFVMVMDTDECVFPMSVHLLYISSATLTAKMMFKFDLERECKLLDEVNNLILLEVGIWDVSVQLYIDGVSKKCWGKGHPRYAGLKASFCPTTSRFAWVQDCKAWALDQIPPLAWFCPASQGWILFTFLNVCKNDTIWDAWTWMKFRSQCP